MYIFLILLLLVIALINLSKYKFEVLHPCVLLSLMFTFCTVIGAVRYFDWQLNSYSGTAVALIVTGVVCFSIGGAFAPVIVEKLPARNMPIRHNRIDVSWAYIAIAVLIGIIANYLLFRYIIELVGSLGYSKGSFSSVLYGYYKAKVKLENLGERGMPGLTNLLNRVVAANSAFALYIFVHNISFKVFQKRDWCFLLIVMFWPIQAILKSGRGDMLVLLAETVYLLYFFWNMYYGWNGSVNRKIILWGSRFLVFFLFVFVLLAVGTGRRNSFAELNVRDYLTKYISVGIRNFDLYIQNPVRSDFPGKETFPAIGRILYNYFGIGELYSSSLEVRTIGQWSIGNIYTGFRRYYADFGLLGLILISVVLGYGFTLFYLKNKVSCYKDKSGFGLLLFAYLSKEIFYLPIEEHMLISELSLNGIFKVILMYLFYYLLIKKRLRFKIRHYKI